MSKIENLLPAGEFIAVLEADDPATAGALGRALEKGGQTIVEVTMRSHDALDVLREMKAATANLVIGAGTVRCPEDARKAVAAGADFLVSPGVTPALLDEMQALGVPALPGVATAGEVMMARDEGFRFLKFFPAEACGGPEAVKLLAGPFADISFSPAGGISADRAAAWFALPNVRNVGASWIASKDLIAGRDWLAVEGNARLAVKLCPKR